MIRKFTAVTLFISFIAMSTSGLMMFFIEKPSFTIQMHPVHKLFGLVMILSVIFHLSFNFRVLASYAKKQAVALYSGLLIVVLMLLYSVAINNTVPEDIAIPMDKLAAKAEAS